MKKYIKTILAFLLFLSPNVNFGQIPSTSICIGTSISLFDSVTGGSWNRSNANATVSGGVVTGITVGTDTIRYIVANTCGSDTASIAIIIIPLPNAGSITGVSIVMVGSVITLTDTTWGGSWSSSNTNATVAGGIVTGISVGIDTITYAVSNFCGIAIAIKIMTINPIPYAGNIVGANSVCVGSTITLTDTVGIGIWSSTNSHATIFTGISGTVSVTGVSEGFDTIMYIVANISGVETAILIITINPLPEIASINGSSNVCVGSVITLTDAIPGGIWSASNANATVFGGVVSGIAKGIDTIRYLISNMCGVGIATLTITINQPPNAGNIIGLSSVNVGSSIMLTDSISGGVWSSSNSLVIVFGGLISGITIGIDTIKYIVSNDCGADTAILIITIKPIPNAGIIIGLTNVCTGSIITLSDTVNGGTWISSNAKASVSDGVITGISAGIDTIMYIVVNTGGVDTAIHIITVNQQPAVPVINTAGPVSVCTGTLFQNYSTNIPQQTGTKYSWSAINAVVWATGIDGQNALISFPNSGNSIVILSTNLVGTICVSKDSSTVSVETALAEIPQVFYFQSHFVCLPSNLPSYQWGYDDVMTLEPTTLIAETNQDYLNANPDYVHNYYWVNTKSGGCIQKTYYNAPLAIQNITQAGVPGLDLYPNPANEFINVVINSTLEGLMQLEIATITGQKLSTSIATDNKAVINIINLPAGFYIVSCFNNGFKIATKRFIKN